MYIAFIANGKAFCGQSGDDYSQNSKIKNPVSCEEMFECFDDFIVYLKDVPESVYSFGQGTDKKDRILLCNVALELNQGMVLSKNRIELRKIIYKTLRQLSGSKNVRTGIKTSIKSRLNKFMGEEIIKKVYFIKFLML